MKISKKYFLFLACLLYIFSIPVTAKEKPQPKKIILNRRNPAVRGRDKKIKRRKGNPQASFCKSRMEI